MALGGRREEDSSPDPGMGLLPQPDLSLGHGHSRKLETGLYPSLPTGLFHLSCLISVSTVFIFSDGRTEAGNLALDFRDFYDIE